MGGWLKDDPPPSEKDKLETTNGLRLYDRLEELAESALAPGAAPFRLSTALISELCTIAMHGLDENPGEVRTKDNEIVGSRHETPPWQDVAGLLDDMCAYVKAPDPDADDAIAIHFAAYVMWRLNWIHPFGNGNGRTSRAVAYLVLCIHLGGWLPGTVTIPDRISRNKFPYQDALEAADRAWKQGHLDVSEMESLVEKLLAEQLEGKP